MRRYAVILFAVIFVLALVAPAVGQLYPEYEVTVTGEVRHGEVIAQNGERYFLMMDDMGTELIESYTGRTVKLTGTVREQGDQKTIIVHWFTLAER